MKKSTTVIQFYRNGVWSPELTEAQFIKYAGDYQDIEAINIKEVLTLTQFKKYYPDLIN